MTLAIKRIIITLLQLMKVHISLTVSNACHLPSPSDIVYILTMACLINITDINMFFQLKLIQIRLQYNYNY